MTEPLWLLTSVVFALHDRLLAEFGGGAGIRDQERLEAALARPRQAFLYGVSDWHTLAASYAGGIIQGHPFFDGNKRTGFVCAVVFLEINGWSLGATEEEAALQTLGLACSDIAEEDYAAWLRQNSFRG